MTVSNTSELYVTENPPQSKKITAGSVKKPKNRHVYNCRKESVTAASATFPRSDFQYNKTVLRNDNISFLINFNVVNNHLRRIILFKIRAAGKLERNYYFFGNCRNTVSE